MTVGGMIRKLRKQYKIVNIACENGKVAINCGEVGDDGSVLFNRYVGTTLNYCLNQAVRNIGVYHADDAD